MGTVLSPSTRMQNTLVIILACLVSAISAEVTCDDCLEFSGNMQSHLMSSESVAEQTELLVSILCPTSPDVAECEDGFRTWWTPIAGAMFPVFLEANSICGQLGACGIKSVLGEPTCEECTGATDALAEIIEFLKGDGFCASDADAATCVMVVEAALPYAMPVLAGVLVERAVEHCCEFSSSGVCC